MKPICKACGVLYDPAWRSESTLAEIGHPTAPAWADALCNECLCTAGNKFAEHDEDYVVSSPLTPDQLNAFLASTLRMLAHRQASGLEITLCDALTPGWFVDDHPHRCRRFPSREFGGHKLCYWHWREASRGDQLFFEGETYLRPRLVAVWARDSAEFWTKLASSVPSDWARRECAP